MNYWEFVTCQRADGRVYGNGGNTCHLGREISPTELAKRRKESGVARSKSKTAKNAKIRYRPDRIKRDLKGVKVARGLKTIRVTRGQTDSSSNTNTPTNNIPESKVIRNKNKKVFT